MDARVRVCARLHVAEAPGFVHSISDESRDGHIELTPGGAATLSCRAVGRPRPKVRWYKDDRRLPAHDDGWIIVLDDVRRQHGGRYTCHVTNRLGSVSRTYIVHVDGIRSIVVLFQTKICSCDNSAVRNFKVSKEVETCCL